MKNKALFVSIILSSFAPTFPAQAQGSWHTTLANKIYEGCVGRKPLSHKSDCRDSLFLLENSESLSGLERYGYPGSEVSAARIKELKKVMIPRAKLVFDSCLVRNNHRFQKCKDSYSLHKYLKSGEY
jgi:hypothetical protein